MLQISHISIEFKLCPSYHEAATYVYDELKKSGIEVELWKFKSDGKKKYFEFTSPIGWDVEEGYLEIMEPKRQKIADRLYIFQNVNL